MTLAIHLDWRDELEVHRPYLLKIVKRHLQAKHQFAEDVVQETYKRCLAQGFDDSRGAMLKTWLITQARWLCWECIRTNGNLNRREGKQIAIVGMELPDGKLRDARDPNDYADLTLDELVRDSTWCVLLVLPERERVIVRRHCDGEKFAQIAPDLGLTAGRTNQLWHKALKTLKAAMPEDVPTPVRASIDHAVLPSVPLCDQLEAREGE